MNWYKRHLGDYAKDTRQLTTLGHGQFTLLLDWYYANERPIPSFAEARTVCRTLNSYDLRTLKYVLANFFTPDGDSFRNKRADQEIAKAVSAREAHQKAGMLGGRPKQNGVPQNVANDVFELAEKETKQVSKIKPSQTPDTIHTCTQSSDQVSNVARVSSARVHVEEIAQEIHKAGMVPQPHDPRFIALVEAGASAAEFAEASRDAITKRHSWSWMLGRVHGRRKDAAQIAQTERERAENAQQAPKFGAGGILKARPMPDIPPVNSEASEGKISSLAELVKSIHQLH